MRNFHYHIRGKIILPIKYKDIPIKDSVTILQIIRTAINVQDQCSEYSLDKAFKLLEENAYDIDVFKRAAQRIKTKYYNEKVNILIIKYHRKTKYYYGKNEYSKFK